MTDDPIRRHVLGDGAVCVTVLSMGAAVQDWQVGGRRMVLGYADPEDYRANPMSMGVICGRVANRIGGARFALDGRDWVLPANDGRNHLHGGPRGFGRRNWAMETDGDNAVRMTLHSPDGDMGYPGALDVTVVLRLSGHALTWDMTAIPDRVTPVNLAQHLYFSLGVATVHDLSLRVDADGFTPTAPDLVPTGQILPVRGRTDFRQARRLAEADPQRLGHDGNFVLRGNADPAAEATAPDGVRLRLRTDQPGLQVYMSNSLRSYGTPLPGQRHDRFAALCLEAQGFPDAVNQPGFPSILCSPDQPYRQVTTVEIAPAQK
ncbi:galactose mutarotase [Thalassococcus sp. CAU 1522]|uniref:Galactose mutarotase n=1 Tax=Thalassococcus arenae TaxID=2851652 RepID=A0ABS6N5I3_9RHOB|nr:aldose epimerase family protein [Thalassococcus arenae]MBV2359275.1 galactose mutarotase [Thalassococcus arenae]